MTKHRPLLHGLAVAIACSLPTSVHAQEQALPPDVAVGHGTVSADGCDLGVTTLRGRVGWRLDDSWTLGAVGPLAGRVSGTCGDDQTNTRMGSPLVLALRRWQPRHGLTIDAGAGLSTGLLAGVRSPGNREYIGTFSREGAFTSVRGYQDHWGWAERYATVVLPLALRYAHPAGWSVSVDAALDVGLDDVVSVHTRAGVTGGYSIGRLVGALRVAGYQEAIRQLSPDFFQGGSFGALAVEPSLEVRAWSGGSIRAAITSSVIDGSAITAWAANLSIVFLDDQR